MADTKISALTSATTPLAGTEVLPIVQSSTTVKVAVSNLTAGRSVSMSASTISSGDLTFSSTAQRIVGDMSNATTTNRLIFQTSTVNSNTNVTVMPNGTATASLFQALSSASDPNNCSVASFAVNGGADVRIAGSIKGTGTYLPIAFHTSGGEKAKIDINGNVLVTSAAGLGYGTGSGGTVTQATSRTTSVTLNKPTGQITMFTAAGSPVPSQFTVTNSLVELVDTVVLSIASGAANYYSLIVGSVSAGSFNINFFTTGGVTSDTLKINFAIIKGASS